MENSPQGIRYGQHSGSEVPDCACVHSHGTRATRVTNNQNDEARITNHGSVGRGAEGDDYETET